MNVAAFQIAFWHPFGPHGGETTEQILARKAREIDSNGWTLWSFQYRRTLDDWHRELISAGPEKVLVFCSSGGGRDPLARGGGTRAINCRSYRLVSEAEWRPVPEGVLVAHAFRPGKRLASAFVVDRIIRTAEPFEPPAVEWFFLGTGSWRHDRMPTRGEYLIRPGKGERLRGVRAILELRPPYLALVEGGEA